MGKCRVKVAPFPNLELTLTLPPCAFMTASTIDKPSPLPSPAWRALDGSTRKKRSNTLD
jgi:hypothetical protein